MQIHQSAEDYLETILMLTQRMGKVRSIDVASSPGRGFLVVAETDNA